MNFKSRSKSFVLQQDQSDCGVACLASVIKYHDGEVSLDNLRKISGTSKQGTTLLGLLQSAKQLGFDADGLEADGIENLKEVNEPAILHVVTEGQLEHYIVFYGFEGERLLIGDPARGIIRYSKEELNIVWQSKALLKLVPNKNFEKRKENQEKKQKWIIDLIREDFNLLLISLFLGIVISLLGLATALFSQKLIDEILPNANIKKLILSLVLVFFLLIARAGLNYLRSFFMIRQGMDFNNRIIQSFYSNLLQLPKSFFDTRKTGELIARMNDTRRIQNTLSVLTGSVLIDFLVIVVSICFVFAYSSVIGLASLGLLIIYSIILFRFNKPIAKLQKEVMGSYAMTEGNFVDTMQGIADIKLSNKISFFEKLNKMVYGLYQQRSFELGKLGLRFSVISEITGVVFIISVFGFASWLVLGKELLLGEMMALLSMSGGIIPSATRLIVTNIQLQEARIAFDRMFEFTAIEKENLVELGQVMSPFSKLDINSVSFRFPGRKQILNDVSLTLKRGEIVALLGMEKVHCFSLFKNFIRLNLGLF